MADTGVEIPDRDLFKASEVCELASVQPYVLRSWELEFPTLGHARSAGSPRVYRRADVERVLRIKHLVFVEGLTLAGARRRIEDDEGEPAETAMAPVAETAPAADGEARRTLEGVKRELRSLLELLDGRQTPAAARPSWPPSSLPQAPLLAFDGDGDAGASGAAGGRRASTRKKVSRSKEKSE